MLEGSWKQSDRVDDVLFWGAEEGSSVMTQRDQTCSHTTSEFKADTTATAFPVVSPHQVEQQKS